MPGRPYVLNEAALKDIRQVQYEIALLPWGATEPHNLHLPFGTDTIQAEHVAIETARLSWEEGVRAVVLPPLPYGVNAQQLGTSMTINMNPSTQAIVLEDVVASLEHHGVRILLIVNGHGGNDFKQMIRELQARTSVFLCATNWYSAIDASAYFDEPGDHAGELETSVVMHVAPELVHPLDEAADGRSRTFQIKGLRNGAAWAPRDWSQVTESTGVGNPGAASPLKGTRFVQAVARVLAEVVTDLASTDLADLYAYPDDVRD